MRRIPIILAAAAVALLVGCGDDSETTSTSTTVAGAAGTTAAGGSATTAPGTVAVTLNEASVDAPTTLKAGEVTFAIMNASNNNRHEFVVMKGKFAELAKLPNGAVDETKLAPGALVGRTSRISAGASATQSFTLTAGDYVLLCNINSGPNSHAADGQRLDVTVA